jgi:CRP/FNR family transcriptional regulator, anaerobic regulatory protein
MSKADPPRSAEAPLLTRKFPVRHASPCDDCTARTLSFCNVLEDQEFERLSAIVSARAFEMGQTIVQEGDEAEYLLNVTSGTLKIFRALPDGRIQIVGFLNEGDFLGVPATSAYAVSAEAVTPVEMCAFPRRSFDRLLNEYPTLERRLFELATNEVAAARDHMLLLGRKTARERVASFLLTMAQKRPCGHGAGAESRVSLPMARTEIADYLGLTIETVSRTLSALRKENIIALESANELVLSRLDALRLIAAGDG